MSLIFYTWFHELPVFLVQIKRTFHAYQYIAVDFQLNIQIFFYFFQLNYSLGEVMFKKSNKRLQRHAKELGFSKNRDTQTPKSSRIRLHHHQRGSLMRKSLEKSLLSHRLQSNPQKRFDDYGFVSKTDENNPILINSSNKLLVSHSQSLFSNKIKVPQMKLEKNQRNDLRKRNTDKNKDKEKQRSVRITQPSNEKDDAYRSESSPSYYRIQRTIRKNRQINQMHMSAHCENPQFQRNAMSNQINLLEKQVANYYREYENAQEKINAYRQQLSESKKKQELVRKLYQQRIKAMEKQVQLQKSYKMGHVYSYKQFPKDFIPTQIIPENQGEFDHLSNETSKIQLVCELSLDSN